MENYTVRPKKCKQVKGQKKGFFRRIREAMIPMRGDSTLEIIRKFVFMGALVAFIITGGSLLYDVGTEMYQIHIKNNQIHQLRLEGNLNLSDEEISIIENEVPGILPEFMSLYNTNSDLVGWIKVGELIDYPVVQGEDNSHYLSTTFDGGSAKSGTIFADYRNVFTPTEISDNTILFGHNMYTSTMFSKLTRYYYDTDGLGAEGVDPRLSFYTKYPVIEFDTLYEKSQWKVFAVGIYNTDPNDGEVFDYITKQNFTDADDFNNYILEIMDRSAIFTDVDLQYGDKILTLSTCYLILNRTETIRCVIFARKVRDGESAEVDVSKATVNYNRRLFQHEVDCGVGNAWNGVRTWDTSKLIGYQS